MKLGKKQALFWVAFAILVCAVPLLLPKYWIFLLTTMAIATLVARSVGVVTNQAGLLSICQMSFAAVGGWVVAALNDSGWQLPYPVMVLAAGVATLPVGLLIGLPALRVRGVELGVVTLGFAVALDLYLRRGSFPGTGEGKAVIPDAPFGNSISFYFLAWATVGVLCVLLWYLRHRPMGLSWAAVRTSERAAAALGVHVPAAKISAFGTAAFFAGCAGGLMAGQFGLLTTDVFTPVSSMVYFAVAITTGAGTLTGALIAGVLITLVPELLRRLGWPLDVGDLLFAAGAIDTLRRGKGGMTDQFTEKLSAKKYSTLQTTCRLSPEVPALPHPVTATPGEGEVLNVEGLTVIYGTNKALDNVSMCIGPREVHALVGPNGAGKSTFVDAVTGFLATYKGRIAVHGSTIDGLNAHKRATGGVRRSFQQSRVIDSLSAHDYIRLAGGREFTKETAENLQHFFGLPPLQTPIHLLDVGSRRILEVAAALAARPKILLLDEPAAGLDEADSASLARRIAAIPQVFGTSVLLIEHDMHLVRAAASHVTVLDFGQVIATGEVDQVLADPRVINAYLGKEVTTP